MDLDSVISDIGAVADQLVKLDACEGAAGNISVCLREGIEPSSLFSNIKTINLPQKAVELVSASIVVTGSGTRMREISQAPMANLAYLIVKQDGCTADLYCSPNCTFQKLTSEFNSHLAVHNDQMRDPQVGFHTVIHAQPPFLTYLSHIPRYQETRFLNTRLLRWQPETLLNLPEGIGIFPFELPASTRLMDRTVELMRSHKVVIWAKHGVIARSTLPLQHALDLIEYLEAAAKYEYMNLLAKDVAEGLKEEEISALCDAFRLNQNIF